MKNKVVLGVFCVLALAQLAGADLGIADWYPQGNNYVFLCKADGFEAQSYDWDFGDGSKLIDISESSVFHTFSDGLYEVSCVATDGTNVDNNLLRIQVGNQEYVEPVDNMSARIQIAPWFPQGERGLDYVFVCEDTGFDATSYDWEFGDGEKLYDQEASSVFHRYASPGMYEVTCAASNSVYRVSATRVIGGGIPEEPYVPPAKGEEKIDLYVDSYYPKGNDYVFVCDVKGSEPIAYTWHFGDGSKQVMSSNWKVFHRYDSPGDHNVTCEAVGEGFALVDSMEVHV